ncbi:hypothetical protein J2W83_000071 [Pseudomonas hunanensis]|uniref:Uncharacterized protein n=1 Tax=Pseudomonas hunanensis TaxID=1247546 RepID=A0ACC6JWC1_9PSED|nr:hypothetical protein [Pseudomonas hunanensis]
MSGGDALKKRWGIIRVETWRDAFLVQNLLSNVEMPYRASSRCHIGSDAIMALALARDKANAVDAGLWFYFPAKG